MSKAGPRRKRGTRFEGAKTGAIPPKERREAVPERGGTVDQPFMVPEQGKQGTLLRVLGAQLPWRDEDFTREEVVEHCATPEEQVTFLVGVVKATNEKCRTHVQNLEVENRELKAHNQFLLNKLARARESVRKVLAEQDFW